MARLMGSRLQSEEPLRQEPIIKHLEYKGVAISVDDTGLFCCEIDDTKYNAHRLSELHKEIESHLKAKLKRANAAPLNLAVTGLVCDGPVVEDSQRLAAHGAITGIDRKDGELIITAPGSNVNWRWEVLLVDTPEHRQLLADLAEAINRVRQLYNKTKSNSIRIRRGYKIGYIDYLVEMEKLTKEYQKRT